MLPGWEVLSARDTQGRSTLFSCSTFLNFFYKYCATFHNCIVPFGFFPRGIRVAFPGESQLRQSRAAQPRVHAGCFSVSIIHRTLTWTTGFFNVRTDVNSCDCARRCTDTVRKSALTHGEKSLAAPGNRTCVGGVPVRCSNQLSYIP